jgi:hypothetical protein
MAGYQPARSGVLEAMEDFNKRRQREVAHFGEEAAAAARDAYGLAIRAGEDLNLPTAGDVMRYGADVLKGKTAQSKSSSLSSPPMGSGRAGGVNVLAPDPTAGESWLDRSPTAKAAAGDIVRYASLVPGAARGAWNTATDVANAVSFASRLFDPYDAESSPRGEAAWDKVFQGADGLIRSAGTAIAHPQSAIDAARTGLNHLNVRLDPEAQPPANTFAGEMRRQASLGLNQGEFLFDAGSLAYGGAEAKGLSALGKAAEAGGAEKWLARGVPQGLADYFATPYTGGGHHYLPQRTRLPPALGGGPVPSFISDSPFFLLKPEGISTGDMYELHYRVDPKYGGGKIPADFGGGRWSGDELGWEKYDQLGRLWHGAPVPLKALAGSGVVGAGALVDQIGNNEQNQ